MHGHNVIRERPTSLTSTLVLDSSDWKSARHNPTIGQLLSELTPANRLAQELFYTINFNRYFFCLNLKSCGLADLYPLPAAYRLYGLRCRSVQSTLPERRLPRICLPCEKFTPLNLEHILPWQAYSLRRRRRQRRASFGNRLF